ncbi:hypothetical protein [Salinibacter sp. 10B]|uniref:hypothetical protein n=1 Tax=Salinibacter sp. 10B TaxID=1923971 RepID=UPI0011B0B322|nr:hypothetical protein [Salinibacter sp. 10B]
MPSPDHGASLTLEAILPAFAACRKGSVLLVLVQAGYHLSDQVRKAMQALSIIPLWLPSYGPALHPIDDALPLVAWRVGGLEGPITSRTPERSSRIWYHGLVTGW